MNNYTFLLPRSQINADFKTEFNDFIVNEDLGFLPSGEGEHIFVQIEKKNENTIIIAEKLAKFVNIQKKLVSYSGLKDKNSIATQWFSLHLPGKLIPDFSNFNTENHKICQITKNNQKLRTGSHKGNFFSIILRNVDQTNQLIERFYQLEKSGFPNYFASQRFGIQNNNLNSAIAWMNNEILVRDRKKRSFYLSALRSEIFNQIVSKRIENHLFSTVLNGDILQLSHSKSWFLANENFSDLQLRLNQKSLQITAPIIGESPLETKFDALNFEQNCLKNFDDICSFLKAQKTMNSRRAIRVFMQKSEIELLDLNTVKMNFWLPTGSFATSLLRELIKN